MNLIICVGNFQAQLCYLFIIFNFLKVHAVKGYSAGYVHIKLV
jgi:hypothetical protein